MNKEMIIIFFDLFNSLKFFEPKTHYVFEITSTSHYKKKLVYQFVFQLDVGIANLQSYHSQGLPDTDFPRYFPRRL